MKPCLFLLLTWIIYYLSFKFSLSSVFSITDWMMDSISVQVLLFLSSRPSDSSMRVDMVGSWVELSVDTVSSQVRFICISHSPVHWPSLLCCWRRPSQDKTLHTHTRAGRCDVQPISVYSVCFQEMRVGICVHSAAVCLFEQSAAPSEGGAALVSEIRADGSRNPAVCSNCSIVFFVSDC